MRYQTHTLFGATLATVAMWIGGVAIMPVVIALGAFGALIPDFDHDKSKGSNLNPLFKMLSIFTIGFIWLFNLTFNLIGKVINAITPLHIRPLSKIHRSPVTHSLMTVIVVAFATFPMTLFVSKWWWIGLVSGVLSHVLIDSINPSGTPLLWPVNQDRIRFIPEAIAPTTGTLGEGIVTIIVVVALAASLVGAFTTNGGITVDDFKMLIPKDALQEIQANQKTDASKEGTETASPKTDIFDIITDVFKGEFGGK